MTSEEVSALYGQALGLEADLELREAEVLYGTLLKHCRREEAWQMRKDAQQGLRRIEKFRAAFGMSEEALHQQLARTFSGYRRSELAEWEKRGWIDARRPDGKKGYSTLNAFNLAYHDAALRRRNKRLAEPDRKFAKLFLDLAEELKRRRRAARTPARYVNPRTFVYSVRAEIEQADLPRGKTVRAWFPFPLLCPATQDIQVLSVRPKGALAGYPDVEAETGVAYLEMPRPQKEKLTVELRVSFAACETDFNVDPGNMQPYDEQGELYRRYTKSEQHIRLTSQTRKLAKSIVGAETNSCLKARKLYDWVCDSIRYNGIWTWRESLFSPYGCASEDVRKRRVGDCLTQSEFYSALCRSVGVPARVCGGPFFLPGFKNDHAWAEVYFAGHGWAPVDVTACEGACLAPGLTDAQRQVLRDFFFGHLDCYRIRTYRTQAAQPLSPVKRSPRRRTAFFTYPELECGGKDVEKYKLHWDCQTERP